MTFYYAPVRKTYVDQFVEIKYESTAMQQVDYIEVYTRRMLRNKLKLIMVWKILNEA